MNKVWDKRRGILTMMVANGETAFSISRNFGVSEKYMTRVLQILGLAPLDRYINKEALPGGESDKVRAFLDKRGLKYEDVRAGQ